MIKTIEWNVYNALTLQDIQWCSSAILGSKFKLIIIIHTLEIFKMLTEKRITIV